LNAPADVHSWLAEQQHKELLRFITCGSVDDGKSTLIGRLLYESRQIFDDQLAALENDSRRHGTQGQELDFALLVDGLSAELEQGITIDVAYRYFSSPKRRFIVADTPGHEQYTRNMVTGASTAELAVLLVDARKGLLTQTRRHSYLAKLLGIRRFVLAVNKMDLVDHDQTTFSSIVADYALFSSRIGIADWTPIPVSALNGANVATRSGAMPWYVGPTLLEHLDTVELEGCIETSKPLRLPVQWVNRPSQHFRGFSGQIASGTMLPGNEVRVLPSGKVTRIERIVTSDEGDDRSEAVAGQSVTVTLVDEIDCSRGDVIVAANDAPQSADQFEATIVWMAEDELLAGRGYWMKIATQNVTATVQQPKYKVNVNTSEQLAATTLGLNEIGVATLTTDREIVFEPYETDGTSPNRILGGFILIDKLTNATVACGMLHFALRRALNIQRQHLDVSRDTHSALKRQRPAVLWFTGLSGAGKSTIANLVEQKLAARGRHTFLLDGDNLRHGLNRDLGFTETDRIENIRRVGEVARLMTDAGLIVLTAFISPFRAERHMVRRMIPEGEFIEIFIDTPLAEAERRDAKGLYAKARAGELKNFTGIDSPYEPPEAAEIRIDTTQMSAEEGAALIVESLLGQNRNDDTHEGS
jgi:bifunctional enzyme CysN/CysC